ncbi:MAG: hypothetical protein V3T69_04020 [Acidiferrobacterales bacterium]
MDSFHHPLHHGVEQVVGLLGIAVSEEFHRALEVSEESRDLLALAFEGRPGGQDFIGEVLRRVRARRTELR